VTSPRKSPRPRRGAAAQLSPLLLLAGLLAALSGAGCASRVAARTIAPSNCEARLLIATMGTEFKKAVVAEVTRALSPRGVCIKVIDVEGLGPGAIGAYAAVVVISDYQFFRRDGDVRRFIEGLDARGKKKLVLLTTAGTPSRVDTVPEVDAITAASKPAEAPAVARRIVEKVRSLLSLK
jgi:hypothetical protein